MDDIVCPDCYNPLPDCTCDVDVDVCTGCGAYFGDFGEVCRRHREQHPESTLLPAQHCRRCRER